VEAVTYLATTFSTSDRGGYRPDGDGAGFTDPLAVATERLAGLGVSAAELAACDDEAEALLRDAVAFALASPWPQPSEIVDYGARWDTTPAPVP